MQRKESTMILMGTENPCGWKLEELLQQVQGEVTQNSFLLSGDSTIAARTIIAHNTQIIGLLLQAEALQRLTMDVLADVAPEEGVHGVPRIDAKGSPLRVVAQEEGFK